MGSGNSFAAIVAAMPLRYFAVDFMLYVIIPVHNRWTYTKRCLESLREQTFTDFIVVVVDDGSTDDTADRLKEQFPEVVRLQGDGTLFWTAATNMGVRYAMDQGADYVMTLNNDTIAPPEFLDRMMTWAQKRPRALLGALGVDADTGKACFGGEIMDWRKASGTPLLSLLPESEHSGLHEVSFFPGRGLLIPRVVIETVGYFDEKVFPHYAADYDYTFLAARHGFVTYCNYDARLLTYPYASGDFMNRRRRTLRGYYNHLFGIKGGGNLRNYTRFVLRNCPRRYRARALFLGYVRRVGGYWVRRKGPGR